MSIKLALISGVTMAALVAGEANAQAPVAVAADAVDAEAIVVTGSRIRRDILSQTAPVQVLDSETLAQTGLSSVADILQRIPSASGGLNGKVNSSGNFGNPPDGGGVGAGSAEIELRYLGSRRTLVLVDGLRFVNGSSASGIPASVDLNSLPAGMIERIEVLQSAASPLYGSDAIAGVVNIITKASQEGLQASAQFGTYREGDGHTQDYNISYGFKGPTTDIVIGASYVKQEAVRSADREISQFPNPFQTSCADPIGGCSSATPLGRFDLRPTFPNLTLKSAVGGKPKFDPLNPTGPNSDFKAFGNGDRFNFAPLNYFLTPSERYGAFISAKQELTDNLNFRIKALWNRRNSQNQAAFLPLFLGPDAGNGTLLDTVSIDATNPFNPFGFTLSAGGAGNPPANYSFIARRLVEAGQRTYDQQVNTLSLTGTLDGSFELGGKQWFWDANAVIGYNDARQTFTGNVNAAKVQQALGPLANCTNPCVPLNIFGGEGSVTPEMLGFIAFTEQARSDQELQDYTLNVSGTLFELPAGPVGVALGYEHRNQNASFTPDPLIQAGLGADIPAQAARGGFNVDEIFGEIRVPLLADIPFIHSLEVNGAVRYADYSTFGGNTTYTGSGIWRPFADLALRGSYSTSLRAPSIGELFGAPSRFDQGGADPCSNIAGSPYQASATVRANCTANGTPANGSYAEPAAQFAVVTGGNDQLQPEKSKTWSFGGAYAPQWARESGYASSLVLEASYYNVEVDGAIASVPADLLLNRCALLGDPLACAAVSRTPNGFIRQINGTLQNIGGIKTRGIDVNFNYRSRETGVGTFGLTWNNTFLLEYTESIPTADGFLEVERIGTERGTPDQAYPRYKSTAIIDWSFAGFNAAFTGRYVSAVTESIDAETDNELGSRFYGDIQIGYTLPVLDNRVTVTLGVSNVFNTDPPACFTCSLNNFDPTTYNIPGQFGYLRLSYKM